MNFNVEEGISILERTPVILKAWLKDLPPAWVSANEGADTWHAYDIVGHYIQGELTDWVPRMKIILSDRADKTFTPFDRFAQRQSSEGKTLDDLLVEFEQLRRQNIAYLREHLPTASDLEKTGVHPTFGTVTLAQLLATWVAHDLNHLGQLARVMANRYREDVGPWKAFLGIMNPR